MPGKEHRRRLGAIAVAMAMALTLMSLFSVISPAQRGAAVADVSVGGAEQAAVNSPACDPTDGFLLVRAPSDDEQIGLPAADAPAGRLPGTRRVDAPVIISTDSSGKGYGTVRGPPSTHRCRG
ncbi:hypothetical protein [Actinoplanes siamensis]|uniref:Uncharacterized protein n=1 Tax=Actinoplanes siamensis TaxID=1223317 RepID=A0A919NC81_9ACTN|nr:hypothetical protein [Actinoplanes siamensis]GIF08532.1 hypothetical protein Asi03nite_60700 [Actinoplanes siamensis]